MRFQKTIFTILMSWLLAELLAAAPANDDCSTAYVLRNIDNWCSSPAQFANMAATPSGLLNPNCFPSYLLDADNDVWFKFVAKATTVNVSVIGDVPGNSRGSLHYPQLAVYQGSCNGRMVQLACISDARGANIVETFVNNLTPGQTYYLRVDGRNNVTGTFQLCVNNFNPVPSPSSDCATAMVLCDKSSFTIPKMQGIGRNGHELSGASCVRQESSSAWFKWTCAKSGSLTFTLRPINPSDDLDFVLFLLPNGVEDCNGKIPIRCMASGENVNEPYEMWQRCSYATGLRSHEVDIMEGEGCNDFDNNFVAAVQMKAGQSYALLVNNFHNSGNGFSIEFGGSGTFAGPTAHFTVSKLKIEEGKELWVKNASKFSGAIVDWTYNFGVGASPTGAKGPGPHKVIYKEPGKKTITISIETESGCKVSKSRTITVLPKPKDPKPVPPPVPQPPPAPLENEETKEESSFSEETEVEKAQKQEEPAQKEETASVQHFRQNDTTTYWVEYQLKYIGKVYFVSDSFNLDEEDFEILNEVVEILQLNPDWRVLVEGRANNIPSDEYIRNLAANRSQSVVDYLIRKGISQDRINVKTFGKKNWKVKDYSLYSRRKDQRVDIKILARKE